MAFNRKQKLRDNIEAIRTAFILDRENRTATTEERAILQRYCGFGGLKCILNPAKELTDAVRWAKSDLELFAPTVELHRLIRENSKDETEYKRFVDSLKASVLTAFYTPKEITDTIADVLADYSVRPARMLEPSAGVGVFVDSMLRHSPNADVMAFEKDLLTGTILRHLYPDQKMRTCGFEKIERPFNNYFDLAVSNIPFGDIAVFDAEFQRSDSFGRRSAQKTIHNYFFLKGLDAVRDGGIVAFITSQGVLNSTKTSVRNELFSQANLVSAIRLPNNLFTDNAGTEVGSDLIVLQKNLSKKEMSQDERLMTVIQTDTKTALTDNAYFIHHPERIVHTMAKLDTDPYGKPAMVYLHEGKAAGIAGDLRRMLDEDFHYRLAMRLYSGSIRQAGTEEKVAVQNKVERPAIKLETVSSAQTVETPTEKPQPADEKPEIEPRPQYSAGVQLTLLDLWGMTEEVSQPKTSKKKKTVKKAVTAKSTPPKPKVTVTPTAPTAKPAMENKEVKAENTAKPADPDDIYATLDWDTNPPINGFYEMMMGLTPERRKELRELARQHNEKQVAEKTEVKAVPETSREQPRQEETQPEAVAAPAVTDTPSEAVGTFLFPDIEAEKPKEEVVDLSPRAYHRTPEMHLREGSLVADRGRHNIGYLKDITPYGATFQPLDLKGYQKEKALLYVSLRDAYERLYRYESLRREANVPWREHLNTCYDEFVMRYGNLNAKQNVKLVMMDAGGRDILSLERMENGKFVKADIFDLPMKRGITTNRNKFVLGPSGSGKSFFMNHLVRQYYEQGAHVVLVDTGNSYQGLCGMIRRKTGGADGVYFTYTEDKPISFNPFYTDDYIFDVEKKDSIKTLLLTLWKSEDDKVTKTESGELGSAVSAYIERIQSDRSIVPSFNTFYEYMRDDYRKELAQRDIKVEKSDFNIDNMLTTMRQYYRGGRYDFLLNSTENIDLLGKRFIVFEIDSIKENRELFPVVTIIIMEAFINKMRRLKGVRKQLIVEEAWKALSSANMAEYLRYMYKTVRKYYGEAIVVTQEVDDIISSPVVKESIINNSDCKILLDQRKYMNKFDQIQALLGLTEKEKSQILSINMANNPSRLYKEVWIGLGGTQSAVYATEVSAEEYLAYTTEETEKVEVYRLAEKLGDDIEAAIRQLAERRRNKE